MDLDAFYAVYRGDGRARPAYEPAMMVGVVPVRVRARDPVLAGDRAGVHRGRRLPRDRGAAQARSRDDRALRRAPPGRAGGRVRLGPGLVREGRSGRRERRRDRWQQGLGEREPRGDRRLRAPRARGASRTRARSTPKRTSASAIAAATSCRRSWRPPTVARSGSKTPGAGWTISAPSRPRRSRATGPSASRKPSGAWTSSCSPRCAPRRPISATGPRASIAAAGGWGRTRSPSPTRRRRCREGEINTTDLDSRMVKGQHGWLQGYNAQAATNEHQIVIAAEIAGRLTRLRAPRADRHRGPPRAHGRRHHRRCPKRGRRRLRLLAHRADATPRRRRHPGPDPARLRAAHDPAAGLERRHLRLHAQRPRQRARRGALPATPAPDRDACSASTKHNRGFPRFHRRGRAAVRTEWRLITATHNLLEAPQAPARDRGGLTAAAGHDPPAAALPGRHLESHDHFGSRGLTRQRSWPRAAGGEE